MRIAAVCRRTWVPVQWAQPSTWAKARRILPRINSVPMAVPTGTVWRTKMCRQVVVGRPLRRYSAIARPTPR